MKSPVVWMLLVAALAAPRLVRAQTLSNGSLKGNYFFRYVSILAASSGSISDPRSLQGTMTFDGAGNYTFTGQQVTGTAAAAAATGKGSYSVDPAGNVAMTNPIRMGDQVNARLSAEALIGSGTETTDSTFDLLVAVP